MSLPEDRQELVRLEAIRLHAILDVELTRIVRVVRWSIILGVAIIVEAIYF